MATRRGGSAPLANDHNVVKCTLPPWVRAASCAPPPPPLPLKLKFIPEVFSVDQICASAAHPIPSLAGKCRACVASLDTCKTQM
jgi:hypothetical protein